MGCFVLVLPSIWQLASRDRWATQHKAISWTYTIVKERFLLICRVYYPDGIDAF